MHENRSFMTLYSVTSLSKIHILTGTYILQENRAHFDQYRINRCCPLCGAGAEDRVHFIAVCSSLEESRRDLICELVPILKAGNPKFKIVNLLKDSQCLTQMILGCSVTADAGLLETDDDTLGKNRNGLGKYTLFCIRNEVCFLVYQSEKKPGVIIAEELLGEVAGGGSVGFFSG